MSLLFFSTTIAAQTISEQKRDTVKNVLEEVIVTATRTQRQLSSVPMPVTLISKDQIKKSGSVRLKDILLEQTGITTVKDVGNSEGVQLQGVAADYTLIMIDGVPIVGRVAGNIDLNRITVQNIKQIEIVKGPSSALYGSEAMGGVINIITEKPKVEKTEGAFQMLTRGGSKNELDINGNFTHKKGRFGWIGAVNLNSSGGYDLTPESSAKTAYPHQNYTLNSQFLYEISKKIKWNTSARYYRQEQYVNETTNLQTDWNVFTELTHKLSDKWNVNYTLYGTQFSARSILNNELSVFERSLVRPEIQSKYVYGTKGTLIGGIGGNLDKLNRTSINGAQQFKSWYAYGQYDSNLLPKLNVVVGARYEGSSSYRAAFSPKISASYRASQKITVKGSVGYGFKIPDFRQLFFDFRNVTSGYIVLGTYTLHNLYGGLTDISTIQKQLRPESSIGYNFGVQWKPMNGLHVNINVFRNNIIDLIDVYDTQLSYNDLQLPQGTRVFTYRNFNSVFTQGVELDLHYKINKNLRFLGGYQFLDTGSNEEIARVEKGIFYRDAQGVSQQLKPSSYFGLPNRSKHMVSGRLFYENLKHQFSLSLRGTYRSEYVPFDSNGNAVIDEFDNFVKPNTQVNITIGKKLFSHMNVLLGVDNLFNETGIGNKELFNYTDSKGNKVANEAYLQLGRTIFGRIQITI